MAVFVGSAWNLLNTENRKAPLVVFVFDDAIIITSPKGLTLTALNAVNLRDMKQVHDKFAAIAPGLSSAQLAALLGKVVRVTVIPTDSVITASASKIPVSRALRVFLADQGGVGGARGDDPPVGKVPPLHLSVAQPGVGRVDQIVVGALAVPHLAPGVAGVGQDRLTSFDRQCRANMALTVTDWPLMTLRP